MTKQLGFASIAAIQQYLGYAQESRLNVDLALRNAGNKRDESANDESANEGYMNMLKHPFNLST